MSHVSKIALLSALGMSGAMFQQIPVSRVKEAIPDRPQPVSRDKFRKKKRRQMQKRSRKINYMKAKLAKGKQSGIQL